MMDKKAQAAMEFLMTYGWAILAAIIAIGVLAYFGVFSPGRFVQDSATLTAPMGVDSQAITTTDIKLEIRNGAGETISVSDVSVSGCGSATNASFPITQQIGSSIVYTAACDPDLVSGTSFRGDITVVYKRGTASLDSRSTGTITGRIP